jgi:hypothetical protein
MNSTHTKQPVAGVDSSEIEGLSAMVALPPAGSVSSSRWLEPPSKSRRGAYRVGIFESAGLSITSILLIEIACSPPRSNN